MATGGWEAAIEDDGLVLAMVDARGLGPGDQAAMADVRALLATSGLGLDADVELFATARDRSGRIVACLGLAGDVVKCAATDPRAQGEGVSARLMQRVTDAAADRGHTHLFAFTKPANREILVGLGFRPLAETPEAVLLENTPFGLSGYVARLAGLRRPGRRIGAVVLNANPFTLGHRYLVERAASESDVLHVFVVGEDASEFGADERLALVRAGIAELGLGGRVVVHPGSRYIVSRATFPNYFLQREAERASAAAGLDLQLFRTAIAPALGITDRFVGSEPLSAVTSAYNREMRHWLAEAPSPAPPIAVHEIERLRFDGRPISASRVRAALASGDLDALAGLVPAPTLAHIRRRAAEKE